MLCVYTCAVFPKPKGGLSGMGLEYLSIVEKSLGDNFLLPVLPSFDNRCDYSIFICRQ